MLAHPLARHSFSLVRDASQCLRAAGALHLLWLWLLWGICSLTGYISNRSLRARTAHPSRRAPPSTATPIDHRACSSKTHLLSIQAVSPRFNTSERHFLSTLPRPIPIPDPLLLPILAPPPPTNSSPLPYNHQAMFNTLDTTAWLSGLSRRKLHSSSTGSDRPHKDADKLLRKVLLRNSLSRVDLALAELSSTTLPPPEPLALEHELPLATVLPIVDRDPPAPQETLVEDFVFPDASSIAHTSRQYTSAETEAEARWLDSLLEDLSDDDDEYDPTAAVQETHIATEEEDDDDDDDFYLDPEGLAWLLSTTEDDDVQPTIISVPSPTSFLPSESNPRVPIPFPLLPDDSDADDDLSTTPGMEEDLEGDSEADSVEWPQTPGSQFRSTASLGRSASSSSLNQHQHTSIAASTSPGSPLSLPLSASSPLAVLPVIREGAVLDNREPPRIPGAGVKAEQHPHPHQHPHQTPLQTSNSFCLPQERYITIASTHGLAGHHY